MRRNDAEGVQRVHLEGELVDLAVAVVLGLAFGAVVNSLVADVFTPLIAAIFGQPDFSAITIGVGESEILIGNFLNALISFLIVAFVLFLVVKAYDRAFPKEEEPAGPSESRAPHRDPRRAAAPLISPEV